MKRNKVIWQICICMAILMTLQGGIGLKNEKFADIVEHISEAIRENYTLAELLELGEQALSNALEIPATIHTAVTAVNENGLYGNPLGESGPQQNVYAVSGGRVLRAGKGQGLGLYVMVEHSDFSQGSGKISTYGRLSDIRVISGERVTKGTILGIYDSSNDEEFYYALEDISGNVS